MQKVLACVYNQPFIKLDVVTDKHLKKIKNKRDRQRFFLKKIMRLA